MKKAIVVLTGAALALVMLMPAAAPGADVVPPVIDLPGTQPQEVGNFENPGRCDNCHSGYDPASVWSNEPSFGWAGGAMGNAGRDPIFWATLAIAEQDFDGAGDLCIRCHSAGGWIAGRSTPTDGSGLAAGDDNGIDCDTCHLATNPDNSEHQGVMSYPFLANDPVTGDGWYGSGMFSAWGGSEKLGPYSDAEARHRFMQSQFHRGDICGTCHDVSNSAVGHFAPNHGAQPGAADDVVTNGPRVHPDPDHLLGTQQAYVALNNPPYAYGIVERTFSEYKSGLISQTYVENGGVNDYSTLPADLKVPGGAIDFAYNAAMIAGGTYEDGTLRTFNCQGCHMRPDSGKGCDKNGAPTRADLPKHDQSGGNYWMWSLIQYQDQQGTLRLGDGLTQFQLDAMDAGRQRAEQQLQMAANLEVIGDTVRITNLTGHKLITGYPEGRRMWLNIKWYDSTQTLLREDGEYGSLGATFTNPVDGTTFEPQSILDLSGSNTRIYEVHPAISQDWAATLMTVAPAVYQDIPIGYDRLTGASTGTIGDLAGAAPGSYADSFHFVLNNAISKDNRIPPYGMDYETARVRNALPVPDTQYGGGQTSPYEYWDELALSPPAGATYADITLYYQGTSWEYTQFLWLANNEQNAFLGQEGVNFLDAWINADPAAPMVPPFVMAAATWGTSGCTPTEPGTELTCDDGIDNDCDGLVDSADPDCAGCTPTAPDDVTCDGFDDDCNGLIDDGFVSGPTSCGVGECAATGELVCLDGSTQDTCTPGTPGTEGPFGDPTCSDALDNDCDGEYDGADADCQETLDCTTISDQGTCQTYPECRWNRKKGCLNR